MKTMVYIGSSLDGFIAKDGDINWLTQFANDEAINAYKEFMSRTDAIVMLSMKLGELLNYLSAKGFSGIYVDGGKVIQNFLKEDLIDELIISKVPVLIGSGIPLFGYLDNDLQSYIQEPK